MTLQMKLAEERNAGWQEGHQEGHREGHREGKQALLRVVVENMHAEGFSLDTMVSVTGSSKEAVIQALDDLGLSIPN